MSACNYFCNILQMANLHWFIPIIILSSGAVIISTDVTGLHQIFALYIKVLSILYRKEYTISFSYKNTLLRLYLECAITVGVHINLLFHPFCILEVNMSIRKK